jgi:hypothetical protein
MIKIIPGKRGSGKTKELIALADAAKQGNGHVIVAHFGTEFNELIPHDIRLVNTIDYGLRAPDDLFGFVAGLIASDYDLTDIFFDGFLRVINISLSELGALFSRIEKIAANTPNIYVTISEDADILPEELKKYL